MIGLHLDPVTEVTRVLWPTENGKFITTSLDRDGIGNRIGPNFQIRMDNLLVLM